MEEAELCVQTIKRSTLLGKKQTEHMTKPLTLALRDNEVPSCCSSEGNGSRSGRMEGFEQYGANLSTGS